MFKGKRLKSEVILSQAHQLIRHFPDRLQIHGDHTQIAPPFNLLSRRSRPIA
jgi:hypothetical protein